MAIKELKTRCNRFSDGSFERLLLCSVLSGIRRALHTSTIRPSAIPGSFLLEGFIESLWQLAKRRSRTSDRFCEFPRRIQNESRHRCCAENRQVSTPEISASISTPRCEFVRSFRRDVRTRPVVYTCQLPSVASPLPH